MSSPKQKATELVNAFTLYADGINEMQFNNAKYCALIAVDEIIKYCRYRGASYENTLNKEQYATYWQQVRTEIDNL